MPLNPKDLAAVRLHNALTLFEEFVRQTARHADAATLRGLERRFAERVQIQPSYWSQIKGHSRQIGERLARQFEQLCNQPNGWMDVAHGAAAASAADESMDASSPRDDDERFIVGLVLTYFRRHPQRARTRLLDLLGEVLTPQVSGTRASPATASAPTRGGRLALNPSPSHADDAHALWLSSQAHVAPLKRKK